VGIPPVKLQKVLQRVFDPQEFLSDYGLRSLSRYHSSHPYEFQVGSDVHRVNYEPAESSSGLFGGNSNWRGPIWFPVNYLVIEALRSYHHHYGENLKVEVPAGSGNRLNLRNAADDLSRRLVSIFLRTTSSQSSGGISPRSRVANTSSGRRPVFGEEPYFQTDPHWRDYILFYEYFHGDTGAGIGASHQTGWTALITNLIHDIASLESKRVEDAQAQT
jgi:hypothetical protein